MFSTQNMGKDQVAGQVRSPVSAAYGRRQKEKALAKQPRFSFKNRAREGTRTPAQPRPEPIAEAVYVLKQHGYTLDAVLAILARVDIQLTLTAHPTEARRRVISYKQKDLAHLPEQWQRSDLIPAEIEMTMEAIYENIILLLVSDELRTQKISVTDEEQHGLHSLATSIWEIVLGYSDRNKDGGYWMANWSLYRAQQAAAEVCRRHEIDLRLFHGRGGTIGRCGGRANQAILDNAPALRKSVALRNPYADVLKLLQIELSQWWRRASTEEQDALRHALFLSTNGIAPAMQSTG